MCFHKFLLDHMHRAVKGMLGILLHISLLYYQHIAYLEKKCNSFGSYDYIEGLENNWQSCKHNSTFLDQNRNLPAQSHQDIL